jgi:uncharacterized membrane protein YukC
MVANGPNSIQSYNKEKQKLENIFKKQYYRLTEAIRPILLFVSKYRYQFALTLGFLIAFIPSIIFLFYSVFGLKE